MLKDILVIALGAVLINNFVLVRFLGICPFLGVSKSTKTALGMGMAVTFVMTVASFITYLVQQYLLVPFHIEYLQTIAFILVISALVQLVELVLQKTSPALYSALGIYLPLITTNCAVLGVAILATQEGYNLLYSTLFGFFAAIGFTLAIVLFSGVREFIDESKVPAPFRGFPIALITAGLIALAFMGFSGFSIS